MILEAEQKLLNTYFWAETVGALILGNWLRKAEDPELIQILFNHQKEELEHAQEWLNAMTENGIKPKQIHAQKDQPNFFLYGKKAENIIEFLCILHVYEKRVPWHFGVEKEASFLSNKTKQVYQFLIKDEQKHLSSIRGYLLKQGDQNYIQRTFEKYKLIENQVYKNLLEYSYLKSPDPNLKEIGLLIKSKAENYKIFLK
jgi:tRNA isopentenyl-2-thiomethyl-A-37 hydroxylase MiaE